MSINLIIACLNLARVIIEDLWWLLGGNQPYYGYNSYYKQSTFKERLAMYGIMVGLKATAVAIGVGFYFLSPLPMVLILLATLISALISFGIYKHSFSNTYASKPHDCQFDRLKELLNLTDDHQIRTTFINPLQSEKHNDAQKKVNALTIADQAATHPNSFFTNPLQRVWMEIATSDDQQGKLSSIPLIHTGY